MTIKDRAGTTTCGWCLTGHHLTAATGQPAYILGTCQCQCHTPPEQDNTK